MGLKFSFLASVILLFATKSFAGQDFWLTCNDKYLMDLNGSEFVYSYETSSLGLDSKVLDFFKVPAINRKAYKHYKIELVWDTSKCTPPKSANSFEASCQDKSPQTVRLWATTDSEPSDGKFEYHHDVSVSTMAMLTTVHKEPRLGKPGKSINYIDVILTLGKVKVTDRWGHHCMQYSPDCRRNGKTHTIRFDHGDTIDCS